MKTLSATPNDPQVESKVARLIQSGSDLEAVIFAMRDAGLNKIESIKLLRNYRGMSLADGKAAVHLSKTWQDCRRPDDKLHESAFKAAEELGFLEVSI